MIIAVGDSHCNILGGCYPNETSKFSDTELFWLGPAKIWGLDNDTVNQTREKWVSLYYNRLRFHTGIIVVSLGEIDLRVNVGERCVQSGSFDPISNLVDIYFNNLQKLNPTQVVILMPPPTTYESHDLRFPSSLDSTSRNALNHVFHSECLKRLPRHENIRLISLFYDFVDDALVTTGGLVDGVHFDTKLAPQLREATHYAVSNDIKATMNFARFNRIEPLEFTYKRQRSLGYSRQCYVFPTDGKRVGVWLHRSPRPEASFDTIQIRPSRSSKAIGDDDDASVVPIKLGEGEVELVTDPVLALSRLAGLSRSEIASIANLPSP